METIKALKVIEVEERKDKNDDPYKYMKVMSVTLLIFDKHFTEIAGVTTGFTFKKEINGRSTKQAGLWNKKPGELLIGKYDSCRVLPYEIDGKERKTFSSVVLEGQDFESILEQRDLIRENAAIPAAPRAPESVSDEETEETITVPKVSKAALTREQE